LDLLPAFPEPAPTFPIPPVPTVTNYACKVPHNNWRCGQMSSGNCLNAIQSFNPTQYYDSFTIPSNGQHSGYGCQAAYGCDDYPEPGLTGLQIQNLFKSIYTDETAADGSKACGTGGRCGMATLSNNCSVTFSTCFNCP
jgi:Meiotically up-regulated gene family